MKKDNGERGIVVFVCLFASSVVMCSVLTSCKPTDPYSRTSISGARTIGPIEQEILFEPPLKPVKQANEVCFHYIEQTDTSNIDALPKRPDSSNLMIEATLIDDAGNRTELGKNGINGPNIICRVPIDYNHWLDISKSNVKFVKLIVRSDRPVELSKIVWVGYNAWDLN